MRRLVEHWSERERRRDGALPAGVVQGEGARRLLRWAAGGRLLTVLGALSIIVVLGTGPSSDGPVLTGLTVVGAALLAVGAPVWLVAAAVLARRELAVRDDHR